MTQVLLLPPHGLVETLPLTSLLSCATLAARPGNWDPADHRGSRLGRTQYGSVGRTTFTLQERSLLRASRVCTPGLVSTATLPSVSRGGYNYGSNKPNNNKVARASAAARGVSFIFGKVFFGRNQENPVFCEVFVNNTMCRCFRFPMFFALVFFW